MPRLADAVGQGGELPEALPDAQARSIHSVIFLDIDGVLNVGVYDTGDAPLLMNEANVGIMKEAQSYDRWQMSEASQLMIEKLASVVQKKGEFVVGSAWQCSDELVRRLAMIIKAGGKDVAVVLASTWRRPSHRDRVWLLQKRISKYLGSPFAFAGRTVDRPENSAADRLELIAEFLVELSNQRSGVVQPLQALILEDFFITGMDGWSLNGVSMNSVADAEGYLHSRIGASASTPVEAKIFHCFEQWTTMSGMQVKVGGGLTLQHVAEAAALLGGDADAATAPQEQEPGEGTGARQREVLPEGGKAEFVTVRFLLRCEAQEGERIFVVGDHADLGAWDPKLSKVELHTTAPAYPHWSAEWLMAEGKGQLDFKFVVRKGSGAFRWEESLRSNRSLAVSSVKSTEVFAEWDYDGSSSAVAAWGPEKFVAPSPANQGESASKIDWDNLDSCVHNSPFIPRQMASVPEKSFPSNDAQARPRTLTDGDDLGHGLIARSRQHSAESIRAGSKQTSSDSKIDLRHLWTRQISRVRLDVNQRVMAQVATSIAVRGAERLAERGMEMGLEMGGLGAARILGVRLGEIFSVSVISALRLVLPLLGMMFVCYLTRQDYRRFKEESGLPKLLFLLAVLGDSIDIAVHLILMYSGIGYVDRVWLREMEAYGMCAVLCACVLVLCAETLAARAKRLTAAVRKAPESKIVPVLAAGP